MTYKPFVEPQTTAFGEVAVAEHTPINQIQFPYNINEDIIEKRENNLGDISQADGMAVMSTGASANSAAHMLSRIPIRYNPGEGVDIRFTALFTTGASNSVQIAGVGEVGDGLFFGFNGTAFSILRREQGVPEIQTLTVTVGASGTGNITINLDSESIVIAVTSGDSARDVANRIAATVGFKDVGLGWSAFLNNATVIFKSWSDGNKAGTFSLVDTDTTSTVGSFAETVAGVTTTNNWTAQTSWNLDVMDGTGPSGVTLDPTKLNVYKIEFQYLGAGSIDFFVERPDTGRYVMVHRIEYANANIIPSFVNPTLPLHIMSKNNANTSDLLIKTGSMAGFIEGKESDIGLNQSVNNIKTSVGTNQTSIIAIKNNIVYQGKLNRVKVRIDGFNVSSDGAKLVTIRVVRNPVLDGTPSFVDVDSDVSVMSVDITGTTFTGGTEILALQLGKADAKEVPAKQFKFDLLPGDMIVVSGATISAGTSDIGVSAHWRELF